MKLYTGFGDKGYTALLGGIVVRKDDLRIECYGIIDELNSHLGVVRVKAAGSEMQPMLLRIQEELFIISSEIAASGATPKLSRMIAENDCQRLEQEIDRLTEQTGPLRNFILPGGGEAAAYCHVARAVCRRAERALIALDAEHSVRDELKVYINRLSDLLFALARFLNHQANIPEVIWLGKDSSGNGQ